MNGVRIARCPRCNSTSLAIIESHEEIGRTAFAQHEVTGIGIVPAGPFDFTPGDPIRVEMECETCGHWWTSRRSVSP